MTSVGATLRSVRERQCRAMAEIAEELCLTSQYVHAIEEDDLKSLPGLFFYKSYVKQYAQILGVDHAQLRPGIDALTTVEVVPQAPIAGRSPLVTATNRRYFSNRSLGGSVVGLVGVLFACSAFYAWWQKPARAVTIQLPVAQQTVIQQQTSVQQPVQQPEAAQTQPTPAVPAATVVQVSGAALNLSATETTWLSITSGGKQIFSGVLEPSQTKILTGLEMAQMKVGNAGGIEVQWNGKPVGPIGPRGEVRVVVFTPDNVEILQSNPPLPAESL